MAMHDPLVLVVNDNLVANRVNCVMLRKRGYEVAVAMDGREAVESCLRRPPVAVVMDIDMPVMDGLAAAAELRRLHAEGALPYIAIVGTSASMSEERSALCRDVGMLHTLLKPVTYDTLCSAVDSAVAVALPHRACRGDERGPV
jgi:CheY-like chemotaxis protein